MAGVENLLFIDGGGNFSKFISRENHRGASHRGTWAGCLQISLK